LLRKVVLALSDRSSGIGVTIQAKTICQMAYFHFAYTSSGEAA